MVKPSSLASISFQKETDHNPSNFLPCKEMGRCVKEAFIRQQIFGCLDFELPRL